MNQHSFSGRGPRGRTSTKVRVAERTARALITIGGMGTIVAVSLILGFLLWVVVPLFLPAEVSAGEAAPLESGSETLALRTDEDQLLAALIDADGRLRVLDRATGAPLLEQPLFDGAAPTCASITVGAELLAFGFADGTVRLGSLDFTIDFVPAEEVPAELADLAEGEHRPWEGGMADRVQGQVRLHAASFEFEDPLQLGDRALRALDVTRASGKTVLCVVDETGAANLVLTRSTRNLMTGKVTLKADRFRLPTEELSRDGPPDEVFLFGAGHNVLLVWNDGRAARIDARDARAPQVAEKLDLAEADSTVTATSFLLGKSTLLVGDSSGRVRAWFLTKPDTAGTLDGTILSRAHQLVSSTTSPVTAIAASPRSRLAAVGHADGSVHVFNVTSEDELGHATPVDSAPVACVAFAPKEDGLLARTGEFLATWQLDPRYPEASLTSLFRPMWYEGYVGPEHVWQSSSGTDDFEPKLGLIPLVFGTLKATFYSMLFGAPIALLAAIYTSEFLDPKKRARTKATIEMMASLPSVVLGFIGALVLAPFVQRWLPETLGLFFTLPVTVLLGAHLWQLLPRATALRLKGAPRLLVIFATIPLAVLLARFVGPGLERLLFAGDLEHWLDGQVGRSIGGWMILFLPLSVFLVAFLNGRYAAPWARTRSLSWTYGQCTRFALVRFVAGGLLVIGVALVLSTGFDLAGLDPRGSFLGTYVQRNALVVGFVMGFAIVPIIYTLAEDALQSVPAHLRFASLGAGATPWQTAMRVIVPTAMSGLFSATMIGLGRAVGETMIVLMATGNTPVMDWNVFNGFRALSANIAYELPEAVQNSTHYRTLFLAAFVLFLMTFLLNTVAEVVRQRFRKRAYQL